MANSWQNPRLLSPIRTDVPELQEKLIALLKQDPTPISDIPVGAKRFYEVSSGKWQWQEYNGSSWATVPFLQHNVDQLDGYHAAITPAANTVAVRNANMQLEGDITGNAVTSTSATTLSQTLPVNKGGTGATTSAAARTNLGVPPTSHASSETTYGLGSNLNYGHVRGDGETTDVISGEIVVKDVLYKNRVSLAKSGLLGIVKYISGSSKFNIDTEDFDILLISTGGNTGTNPPGFNGWLLIRQYFYVRNSDQSTNSRKQVAFGFYSNEIFTRYFRSGEGWYPWVKVVNEKDLATSSAPGIVKPGTGMSVDSAGALNVSLNNTVTSTSTTDAATANAVKMAYDKAEEASNKSELPLGHIYLWPFTIPPDGSIQVNGSTYSRELYSDLWNLIQEKGWYKSESEWQSIASANGGYCPWYSDGDGSTTFRTPKFAPYQKLALVSGDAGKYYSAGLPNITGSTRDNATCTKSSVTNSGALKMQSIRKLDIYAGHPDYGLYGGTLTFDASRSNSIYGNSTTVQPKSHDWIVCVVAFGTATNVGSVDVSNVMSAIEQVQANPNLQGTAHIVKTWNSTNGKSWYRKWSDGWIEQGGITTAFSVGTGSILNFPMAFNIQCYSIVAQNIQEYASTTKEFISCIFIGNPTKTSVNMKRGGTSPIPVSWYACGY